MLLYCGQTVGRIKMKLGVWVGLSLGHSVRRRPSSPSPKGAQPPIFGSYLVWSDGCMDQDATWYGGRPGPVHHPKKGRSPQFLAHIYCSQPAAWIKMPLGMEVGLSLRDFVLDGDVASPEKGHTHPIQFLTHVYCGQTLDGSRCHLVRR